VSLNGKGSAGALLGSSRSGGSDVQRHTAAKPCCLGAHSAVFECVVWSVDVWMCVLGDCLSPPPPRACARLPLPACLPTCLRACLRACVRACVIGTGLLPLPRLLQV